MDYCVPISKKSLSCRDVQAPFVLPKEDKYWWAASVGPRLSCPSFTQQILTSCLSRAGNEAGKAPLTTCILQRGKMQMPRTQGQVVLNATKDTQSDMNQLGRTSTGYQGTLPSDANRSNSTGWTKATGPVTEHLAKDSHNIDTDTGLLTDQQQ